MTYEELAASGTASPKQLETFAYLLTLGFEKVDATIVTPEDDIYGATGCLCVETIEDERHSHAFFGIDGKISGNWS
jgi:hypothetical protein